MARKQITVINQTLANAPFFQRLMCGSNGKCLLTFDQLTHRAHNGGMLIGDKNAAGTNPFIILVGGVQSSGLYLALRRILSTTMRTLSSMCSLIVATMASSCSSRTVSHSDCRRLRSIISSEVM